MPKNRSAQKRPYIVSTTITNNRADVIGPMLAAIAPEVDLCLVIDTGVTDNTMRIAAEVCGPKLVSISWPWRNDFAAARNRAMAFARAQRASWAITADTDETLFVPMLRTWLRAEDLCICQPPVYMLNHSSGTYQQPRIYQPHYPGLTWRQPVHEYLAGYPSQGRCPEGWRFTCVPRPTEDLREKYTRYLAILETELARDPKNARAWYYLGDCYEILGDKRAAIAAWRARVEAPLHLVNPNEAAWAMWRAAKASYELGGRAAAIAACRAGRQFAPRFAELWWFEGWLQYESGRYARALECAEAALRIGETPERIGFSYPPAQKQLPEDLRRWCLFQLSRGEAPSEGAIILAKTPDPSPE